MGRPATGQLVERRGNKGTTYAARFHARGARQYVTLGCSWEGYTRRQAETDFADILADVRRGMWRPPTPAAANTPAQSDPTFHEFASEWYESRRREVASRTADDYRWALTHHLLPFFAGHHLSAITIAEVDRYRAHKVREREDPRIARPLSSRSINSTLGILAQVLEVAVEYGLVAINPARGRRRRLKPPPARRSWLEPEQIKPLLDSTVRGLRGGRTMPDVRMQTMFATALCTGLRVGELLQLRWRDVRLAQGRLTVTQSKTDAGQGRDVDLWEELRERLALYKAQAPHTRPDDFVFATATGRADTRSNVAKRLKRAVARANDQLADDHLPQIPADLSPHSLRRTFASLLYLRGENPVYVMHQMGHTDPKLALRIYTKVLGEQRRRGPGSRLVAVLEGAQWTPSTSDAPTHSLLGSA